MHMVQSDVELVYSVHRRMKKGCRDVECSSDVVFDMFEFHSLCQIKRINKSNILETRMGSE